MKITEVLTNRNIGKEFDVKDNDLIVTVRESGSFISAIISKCNSSSCYGMAIEKVFTLQSILGMDFYERLYSITDILKMSNVNKEYIITNVENISQHIRIEGSQTEVGMPQAWLLNEDGTLDARLEDVLYLHQIINMKFREVV